MSGGEMSEPRWLTLAQVTRIHQEQLVIFGGPAGVRDVGLLQSAIDRPRNKWSYGERDFGALAAAYGFGLAKNHPFIDGNKRAAFAAIIVFMAKNGKPIEPAPADATHTILELAAGNLSEVALAAWITQNIAKT
jgi:death on curing protein